MTNDVAVLGTGLMGAPMALNLARAGFGVRVWNRTPERAERLEGELEVVSDPERAVTGAAAVVTMLSDAAAVESVMAEGGVLKAMDDPALWLQMSTIGVEATARCAEAAAQQDISYFDAPVLGTKQPAEAGELIVMASGPESERERARPYFEAVGKKIWWLGEAGAGTRLKLVVNTWLLALVGGLAETVAFAESIGIDPQKFLDVIEGGPMGPAYAQIKGKAMIARSFEPAFPLVHARKDAGLVLDAAQASGARAPLTEAVKEQLDAAVAAGHGDEDMAAALYAYKGDQ
jgi:3-hydroxyisobutyrate dehydrogenase